MVWYFTFGLDHKFGKRYVKIEGDSEFARKVMFDTFGNKWCAQYSEKKWAELKDKYFSDLTELKLD